MTQSDDRSDSLTQGEDESVASATAVRGSPKATPMVGVGMPAALALNLYGQVLYQAFGETPYMVGSAFLGKTWRDVDVRVMLDDTKFRRLFRMAVSRTDRRKGEQALFWADGKWAAFCWAFSVLGREMTGLPIDFQVQPVTYANETFNGPRQPLGLTNVRW